MTRGKNQQAVTSRLRSQLADADARIARLEADLRQSGKRIEEIARERDNIIEHGTPQYQEDQARWEHGRAKVNELVENSERIIDQLREAMEDTIKWWAQQLDDTDGCDTNMSAEFAALMFELFGADFYTWAGLTGDRADRRDFEHRHSPESVFYAMREAMATEWDEKYGRSKSRVVVEKGEDGKFQITREERPEHARHLTKQAAKQRPPKEVR
jgi:hypothetical protein